MNDGKKSSVCSHLEGQLEILRIDDGVLGNEPSVRDWFRPIGVTGWRRDAEVWTNER